MYDWVGHILSREREERRAKVLRLSMLGWTNSEIGELLGVSYKTIERDGQNCETAKMSIRDLASQHIERHEIARRFNLPPVFPGAACLPYPASIFRAVSQ